MLFDASTDEHHRPRTRAARDGCLGAGQRAEQQRKARRISAYGRCRGRIAGAPRSAAARPRRSPP
jgi:hypothetical protein